MARIENEILVKNGIKKAAPVAEETDAKGKKADKAPEKAEKAAPAKGAN
jgi:hypothetical protein